MRREVQILAITLVALSVSAQEQGRDWTCVPAVDGKTWDCGYGRDKPEQRFLATPDGPSGTRSSQGAPLGFSDPGKAGPIGIAPLPATPARRITAPSTKTAPAAAPQSMRIATGVAPSTPIAKPSVVNVAPALNARPSLPQAAPRASAGRGPSAAYTVQIIGLSQERGIEVVAARLARSGLPIYRLRSERNGAPWHVLTVGEFANQAEARAAIARLPDEFIKGGAWARQVSTLLGAWR